MPRIKGQLSPEARERQIARQRAVWLWQHNAKDHIKRSRYEALKRWRARHPEAAREQYRKDAMRKRRSGREIADHTPDEYRRLAFYVCGNRCLSCGADGGTLDHITPVSRGGKNLPQNLQVLCLSCNSRKHAQTIDFRNEDQVFGLSIFEFLERHVCP